jgi:hypothetical protein
MALSYPFVASLSLVWLGTCFAAAGAVPSAAPLTASNIERIEISSSSVGEFGDRRFSKTVAHRVNGVLRADGGNISDNVEYLVRALGRPPIQLQAAYILGYDEDHATDGRDIVRGCIGDGADVPGVVKAVVPLIYDPSVQAAWAQDYYGRAWVNRYARHRHEEVRIHFADGSQIVASSDRQQAYMLPFTIAKNGSSYVTYDPQLAAAISALGPTSENSDLLDRKSAVEAYSEWLCKNHLDQIGAALAVGYAPSMVRYAENHGLAIQWYRPRGDLSLFRGHVRASSWPAGLAVAFDANGEALDGPAMDSAGIAALKKAVDSGDRVTHLKWIRDWLEASPKRALRLASLRGSVVTYARADVLEVVAERIGGFRNLLSNDPTSIYVGILSSETSTQPSWWFFLPDGTAVLTGRDPGSTIGPLVEKNLRDTITIVNPDGTVVP